MNVLKKSANRILPIESNPKRHSVHKRPDNGYGAVKICRATGERGAENDVGRLVLPREHERPGALHKRIHSQLEPTSRGVKFFRSFSAKRNAMARKALFLLGGIGCFARERGRLREAGEHLAPKLLRSLERIGLEPTQIVPIGRDRFELRRG